MQGLSRSLLLAPGLPLLQFLLLPRPDLSACLVIIVIRTAALCLTAGLLGGTCCAAYLMLAAP